jgi:UDP-N-acetylmuramoyl-tripeptide--D-alanyl-D-alanine ligase
VSFTTSQLANYVNGKLEGNPEVHCSGAEIDSRRQLAGKVFFALKGEQTDGHQFVESAIAKGCAAIVVERSCISNVPVIIVEDARKALFQLALSRREEMDFDSVIAVTGSVGKTTTKDILASLLGANAIVSRESFNNDLGVPLTVLGGEKAQYLVLEIGANAIGEIEPLAKLARPDVAILTSIEKAHLEGFGDEGIVLQEKGILLQSVSTSGFVIIPDTIDVSSLSIQATIVRVGITESADVQIETGIDKNGFATISIGGCAVTLSLLGEHNAMNAALAIVAVAKSNCSIETSELLELASHTTAPKGRLHSIEVNGISFLNDAYNANPASMRSALKLFSTMQAKRKVLVLGDMLELGTNSHFEHRSLASFIEKAQADLVFLVGNEMKAVPCVGASIHFNESAIDSIASLLKRDDLVLLKGSRGLRLEQIIDSVRQTKVLEH